MPKLFRHREDARSVAFVLITVALQVGGVVLFHAMPWVLVVPWFLLTAWMSWLCAVITHNTVHHPVFTRRWMNKAFQHLLTLSYGNPVSAFVPGHNLSHHLHTQTRKDVMRTSKMRFGWNLLNQLLGPVVMGKDIAAADLAYAKAMRHERPRWFRQWIAEWIVALSAKVVLFFVDPLGFLVFTFLPHTVAAGGIIGINFLQHDGLDRDSTFHDSRNLTGRWINWWAFNNGYHTIHHRKPWLHWTDLPAAHAREIAPFAHPGTDVPNFPAYLWSAYVWPGQRLDYLGRPHAPEPVGEDEAWIPDRTRTPSKVSLGAEG